MKTLRTPDDQFVNLPDYDFEPNYMTLENDLRMHYVDSQPRSVDSQPRSVDSQPRSVDKKPRDGRVVIMMHGEPSWSFLYRHMIKDVAAAGYRVLAPDLIGFGKSDKPTATSDYSYSRHVGWMSEWFARLDVSGAVLFCQDWGGLLGLRLVAKYPERFAGVIAANTFLPTGERDPGEAFKKWREFAKTVPEFPVGGIIGGAVVNDLGAGVKDAYNAPYPDESYKAGARIFPALVPTSPDMDGAADNVKAWKVLSKWDKPFLTSFSDQDPITKGADKVFQKRIPGCQGQPHQILKGGGHFLQEDVHAELSEIIIKFCESL